MLPWPWLPGTPAPVSGITHGPESRAGPSTMHRDSATGQVLGYSSDCRCYYDDSLPVVANFKLNLNTEYRDVCHGPGQRYVATVVPVSGSSSYDGRYPLIRQSLPLGNSESFRRSNNTDTVT